MCVLVDEHQFESHDYTYSSRQLLYVFLICSLVLKLLYWKTYAREKQNYLCY